MMIPFSPLLKLMDILFHVLFAIWLVLYICFKISYIDMPVTHATFILNSDNFLLL